MDSGAISQLVFFVFAAAVFLYGFILYKDLARMRDDNDLARTRLDASLRNLLDEIPNLIDISKSCMPQDDPALRALIQAHADCRAASGISQKASAQSHLNGALQKFVEKLDPRLAADPNFVGKRARIAELQQHISAAAESFNNDVKAYNARIGQFPDAIVASIMGLQRRDFFPAHGENPQKSNAIPQSA